MQGLYDFMKDIIFVKMYTIGWNYLDREIIHFKEGLIYSRVVVIYHQNPKNFLMKAHSKLKLLVFKKDSNPLCNIFKIDTPHRTPLLYFVGFMTVPISWWPILIRKLHTFCSSSMNQHKKYCCIINFKKELLHVKSMPGCNKN